MIRFEQVAVTYEDSAGPTLHDVTLQIAEGELALVVGPTGCGKSTLLRTVNGLVPHFSGGILRGAVTVADRSTRDWKPRDLTDVVGFVAQDPLASFVTDTVEDELAYTMESLGVPPSTMRVRVEETLDLLGLSELRHQPVIALSGGQRQRTAIGAALTAHPRVLVLDEPTSALDPQAAEEVLAAIQRLVHDLGMTVLMAEHRLERVIQYADRIIELDGGTVVADGTPETVMQESTVAPPVIRLGRLLEWSPLPTNVRDARRRALGLRRRLEGTAAPAPTHLSASDPSAPPLAIASDLAVRYGSSTMALRGIDFSAGTAAVTALMGRNGAGKSTLLGVLAGLIRPVSGRVRVGGLDPAKARPAELVRQVGLVPQDPGDLLYAGSVDAECRTADNDYAVAAGVCAGILTDLAPEIDFGQHPRDLSEGQRMCLALAVVLAGAPPLLLLDEPTRGLDYGAKQRLAGQLRTLASTGHGIVLSTHDVELVAELADRVVVLADGEVVADGPSAEVVTGSPMFAPQVAKILAPVPLLTVTQVAAAVA